MNHFSKRTFEFSPQKRALLEKLLQHEGLEESSPVPPLARRQNGAATPLSFAQQRLWFLDQWESESPTYSISRAFSLLGSLSLVALEHSFSELAQRHEALRTTFVLHEDQPVQVIAPSPAVMLSVVDLAELSAEERGIQEQNLARQQARHPFDLTRGPLLWLMLLRFSDEEHVLLLTFHHIIADGWSLGVLLRELSVLYQAAVTAQPSPLPPLPLQYADYALWQRDYLQGEALQTHLAYWQTQLEDASMVLDLPTDRPRPPVQTFHGAHVGLDLPQALTLALRTLSQREGVTLFMTLLGAFATLLWRYSGQDDLLIGTPIANRHHQHLEGLIGNFANTLVLRLDLAGSPNFLALLARVREVCLGAYAHQDLPFEQLVEALAPPRDLSRSPLFQIMFAHQNLPSESLHLAGIAPSAAEPTWTGTARLDLMLTLRETPTGLHADVEYNTALFESSTIERMTAHYHTLLEEIVAHPEQRLAELPLLSPDERQWLLHDANATSQPFPHLLAAHHLFQAQAARSPEAIALLWQEQHLSYHQLNHRANQLAHSLLLLGVGPERLVGLCLERSPDLLIALLAILKAGGAYLPLDPTYPPERLAFMLADAHCSLVLTRQSLLDKLQLPQDCCLCLEELPTRLAEHSHANPPPRQVPANLAYVLYTSGSTGLPKGVAISHSSVSALLAWAQHRFAIQATGSLLASTSICFDLSVFELLLPLSCGGTVLLVEDLLHPPGTLAAQAVTWLNSVPSVLSAFLVAAPLPAAVRTVTLAGETLPAALVARLYEQPGVAEVYNLYGPSEDTTYSTWALLRPGASDPLPIGEPIANSQVYVLDATGQLVPRGVLGELCLGGAGLARGYVHQPELTAERFVPDPFSSQPGARLYRTGDLVRRRADGQVAFVGRADSQVKLRGYRIELGEIEAVLRQHPGVREALVMVREDTPGDKRLVGYVVPAAQPLLEPALRAFLAGKLPEYMLPGAWVQLDRFPLTPNGKLDRRAMPAPERLRPEETASYRAARTPLEEVLTGIWAEVLGLEQVGVDDHFFELGGHSLLATQVVARLRKILHTELPLRILFEAPTIARLALRLADYQSAEARPPLPALRPLPRPAELPLAFAQQRLWFLSQLEPESPAYHLPLALRLSGPVHVRAFEQTFSEIIGRHEVLRTTFALQHDSHSPVQRIHPPRPLPLTVIDLSDLSLAQRAGHVQQLASQEALLPFDLEQGPLLRVGLLRLREEEHVLLVTMHHIVMDGWSLGVLLRELSTLYQAYTAGQSSPLSELPLQYADYALWQRHWLQGEVLESQLAYWHQRLQDAPFRLELPTDRPRPMVQTSQGDHYRFNLPEELSRALLTLSRREGVTLFMTLLAAFATLLWRYSGQDNLLIGTPIANRIHTQLEELIGFFANTLVLRADLSENPSFQQVLGRVREVTLQAYAHQDLPFEYLVEALQPQRDLSYTPLFQVMFVLQNAPRDAIDLPELHLETLAVEQPTSRFDLTLTVQERAQGLEALFEYNTALFDTGTITRIARHWQRLLAGMAADPGQPLARLPLLTWDEREQLLREWNQSSTAYPGELCLHQLFEAQVARTPETIALVFEDEHLSYLELNRRANQLAHCLQRLGVRPEVLVGIYLEERSVAMIVALLGILKAGGAYLPLEVALPPSRLAFLLADALVGVVLTQHSLLQRLPDSGIRLLCLDEVWETLAGERADNPTSDAQPENLAYVMYTSGSTGQPKGVCISHTAVKRLVCNPNYIDVEAARSVAHASNPSFDAATFEIWAALLHGARLIGISKEVALAPQHLATHLHRQGVEMLFVTTALFNQVAGEVPWAFGSLHQLLFGGEAVEPRRVKEVLRAGAPGRLLHMYGPTENTTFSSWHLIQEVPNGALTIPIGRPIANTQIYLLDAWLEPVALSVIGEVYLGGDGLARGYLNRPHLTAERFVPHPFSHQPGARLYRTGDLAHRLPDGSIEFVGRIDQQIKLRGLRIELGEIEAVLVEHPGVREAAVVAREDVPGDKRLVGYVVPVGEQRLSLGEVRRYVQSRLPDYMVPSTFMLLERLPLTANGKLDRRGLPTPVGTRPELEEEYVAPRNPIEEVLVAIWSEVLGLESIGIEDAFFQLGGHSLLATQVMARVREALQVEVPLRALFEAPTVAGLAEHIAKASQDQPGLEVALAHTFARKGPLPLSFAQQRLWFLDQFEPENPFYNISASFHLAGPLHLLALQQSLDALLRRHDILRTSLVIVDGSPTQLVAAHLSLPLVLVALDHLSPSQQAEAVARLAQDEAQQPFDLARGSLLRVHLLRLGPQEHIFLLCLHHIVADGWSLGVLLRELSVLYQAAVTAQPSPLPTLPLQYADYALWQRDYLQGEALQTLLTYWQQQLRGAPMVLDLPTDRPRPLVQTFHGAHLAHDLPQELALSLKALSRRQGVTLFMTLLAAFATLLWRYSGQDDLLIGTPIANRRHQHLEGLIGNFANTLVLRTDLAGSPTFLDLLGRVREMCLGAYAHQDLPFEQLVEALAPPRDLSRSPLFQVMFAHQNLPSDSLHLAGLAPSIAKPIQTRTAKLDLMLTLRETPTRLRADVEYNTSLFEPSTIEDLLAHYQCLLAAIVLEPTQPLAHLSLLSAAERQWLLHDVNATSQPFPHLLAAHQLFEAQAARTPEAIALLWQEQHLTYHQLNHRANLLAHSLMQLGVGPEHLVGLCLERSPDLLIALLAILKAGGAYLPLDPTYPPERLAFMLADAHCSLVLTRQSLLDKHHLPQDGCLCLEELPTRLAEYSHANPPPRQLPQNLAYVLYTSGSTGLPKGVAISHSSVSALLAWAQLRFATQATDSLLASTSICFDLSVFELLLPLSCGGTVLLVEDLLELPGTLAAQAVTWLNSVPSVLSAFLAAATLPEAVRTVTLAGEPLSAALVERLYEQPEVVEVYNLYGPSEDTTYSTWTLLPPGASDPLPIGEPIANSQAYVLDGAGQPVPRGVLGELFLGGAGLARGYVQQPELTAERFVPDPFSAQPGQRLYRTGDLVRRQADGQVAFVGRADSQVKLRGYRIELGEIEAVLRQHPGVREAVVVVREDTPGDRRLVAYVVPVAQPLLEPALRAFVAGKLPDYMLPGAWVQLDRFPLTPNGKLDRRAMPAPERLRPEETASYRAARTPLEEVLTGIWAEVLGLEQIGLDAHFFELGGHSLLATQVVARLRKILHTELPLRILFEAPTIARLALRLADNLDTESRPALPALRPLPRPAELPLAFAQQRLWFLSQLEPESPAYHLPLALRLSGHVHVRAFEQTFSEIIARHEALRTTFTLQHNAPAQHIHPPHPLPLTVIDLSGLPIAQRTVLAQELASQEALLPFDLEQGPLLRVGLLRLQEEEQVLLVTMHHIVMDGWSLGVLLRELSTLYQAYTAGHSSPLPELPLQYADYALWQRNWLQGEVLESQLAYWQAQLAGAPQVLDLPTDHPRPAAQTFRGAQHYFELPRPLSNALKALSRREGVSLFMTLLAAFATLLWRYSGQDDLLIGTPIANRRQLELEGLVGFFANTLVLRTDLSGNPSVRTLLGHVRQVALDAYAHQDVPLEHVVDTLHVQRDLSRSPLFQVVVALQHGSPAVLDLGNVKSEPLAGAGQTAKFDLTLSLRDTGQGLVGALEYSTDLFEPGTIARMAGHWQRLLAGMEADPGQPLAHLPLLTQNEEQVLLREWNQTSTAYPSELCLHQLFEAQVARTPEAIALVFEDEHLSYLELNRRANQLAHYLQKLGVRPEVPVGICVERSLDMVVGILGILKAGGAYLPLDPTYPQQRLAYMLADARVPVVLTQQRLNESLHDTGTRRVYLDSDWPLIARQDGEQQASAVSAENLAYIIYTSGSTGRPKGVACSHRGVVNLLADFQHRVIIAQGDGCSLWCSFSFDVSVYELFSALLAGGTLHLVPEHVRVEGRRCIEWLHARQIRSAYLPPFMLGDLLNWLRQEDAALTLVLRRLLVGVEPIPQQLLIELTTLLPSLRIINGYGPTETTICSTLYDVSAHDADRGNAPIGRPVQNTHIYLLDAYLQPVPLGVPGELYIGGVGVGRGYSHQPDLTAGRFLPDPFSLTGGARLYTTGDLARYRSDGNIEFLGRRDSQVKLRGYRIEPGEIEAVLRQHLGVREAVVVAREDTPGDRRLVAYFVPTSQQRATASDMRGYMQAQLPSYMVPSTFVPLDALPLSPNGKLDRGSLPLPPQEVDGYMAPRNPLEEIIALIWAEVLGLQRVGVDDNFFLLGGHSLLATQVVSRLREFLHKEMPLRTFFENPTVAELARSLSTAEQVETERSTPALHAFERQGPLPLSFAQQRLWFLDRLEPENPFYNISASFHLSGPLHLLALQQSLDALLHRHENLRTSLGIVDGSPAQIVAAHLPLPLVLVALDQLPPSQQAGAVARLTQAEAQRPFDLATGPLLRIHLLRLGPVEHVFLLCLHHIVADGWSLGVLLRELSILYQAYASGKPSQLPALPPLTLQYADYALWQRQALQGEMLQTHLAYWQRQLHGASMVLDLPTDRPRPPVQTFRGAQHFFVLPQALTDALHMLSRREGVTLFMTLLVAFATLLWRYSGQDDLLIGTPIANRRHQHLEGLIGFFVNTLVLRVDLSGSPRVSELLARIREMALDAYTHQDLPFEKLVEELAPERSLSHSPLFQVMFALQNEPLAPLNLAGLTLTPGSIVDPGTARLDLILNLVETAHGLRGCFEYNTDLFETATIERMVSHLQQLLAAMINDPLQQAADLPLLTESERTRLLLDWNATGQTYPHEVCLHQLFEAQVARTPDAIAVVSEEDQLTYRELNRRANQLASYLQRLGVGPEVPVGVCLPRSLDMTVSVLAILKAGGAYVPLDPTYPPERLSFMLQDCHIHLLLTQQSLSVAISDQQPIRVFLDLDAQAIANAPDSNPPCQVRPQNMAYIIYTSGSTGRPKGVMVSHQAIVNRLRWGQIACQLTPSDHMLHIASLSFDIAIWEIFAPWLSGARLILAREAGYQDISYLISLLNQHSITIAHFVPTLLHLLVEQEELGTCRSLRWVLYGGEASSPELPRRLLARLDTRLQQFYGPTEATINATCWRCEDEKDADQVSIGRPIANTQIYLLDARKQSVPVGITGELYIGGAGLARGYLRRPELTAERFLPDPFSSQPGLRLYRTGDLARYLPDGTLMFVGRSDGQVKLRGYRIELGEIEAILGEHPGVREALILLREDLPGDKRLVAYVVVAQQPSSLSSGELRRHLQERLPDYMLPSALMLLDYLPVNAHGKVDRLLLPAPEGLRPELETIYSAPQTAIEQTIAVVWREVLQLEKIGRHDNFFDLGGHSLLMVRVQGKLREVLRRELPIVDMFKYPSISSLATYLSQAPDDSAPQYDDDRAQKRKESKDRQLRLRTQTQRGTKGAREL